MQFGVGFECGVIDQCLPGWIRLAQSEQRPCLVGHRCVVGPDYRVEFECLLEVVPEGGDSHWPYPQQIGVRGDHLFGEPRREHLVARTRCAVESQSARLVLAQRHHADLIEHVARTRLRLGRACGEAAAQHGGDVGRRME